MAKQNRNGSNSKFSNNLDTVTLNPCKKVMDGQTLSGNQDLSDWIIGAYNQYSTDNQRLLAENKTLRKELDSMNSVHTISVVTNCVNILIAFCASIVSNLLTSDINQRKVVGIYVILALLIVAYIVLSFAPVIVRKITLGKGKDEK